MSWGGDEVQAAMHSVIGHLSSVHAGLWVEVILKLAVDVIDDWLPAAKQDKQPLAEWYHKALAQSRTTQDRTHQLLLSTASPNPGVSTIVRSSWTPPSFTNTLDCSTCNTHNSYPQTPLFNPHLGLFHWHGNTQKAHVVSAFALTLALQSLTINTTWQLSGAADRSIDGTDWLIEPMMEHQRTM